MYAEAIVFNLCLSIIVCDSMTVYLSSMMTRKPCKVHASSTEKKMMVKYTENTLNREIILYPKYPNVSRVTHYNSDKEKNTCKTNFMLIISSVILFFQGLKELVHSKENRDPIDTRMYSKHKLSK